MIAKTIHELSLILGYKEQILTVYKDSNGQPAYETVLPQLSTDRLMAASVIAIVKATTGLIVDCKFDNADNSYKLVDIDTLKEFIKINNLARYKYVSERRDCDDFSFMMQGDVTHWDSDLAFGIIWGYKPDGSGHAWNWCIGTDLNLWFIEPQTNKVFRPVELWRIIKLEM